MHFWWFILLLSGPFSLIKSKISSQFPVWTIYSNELKSVSYKVSLTAHIIEVPVATIYPSILKLGACSTKSPW